MKIAVILVEIMLLSTISCPEMPFGVGETIEILPKLNKNASKMRKNE